MQEVEVKWQNWDGANSWIALDQNPELEAYLAVNKANPESCSLLKHQTDCSDLAALRQMIFDSLGDIRRTPDGSMGRQTRITVKLPFRTEAFQAFRDAGVTSGSGNVDCYLTPDQVTAAIGEGWQTRGYKTSTETFVSSKELVHLNWGYTQRKNYNHASCKRYFMHFISIFDYNKFILYAEIIIHF